MAEGVADLPLDFGDPRGQLFQALPVLLRVIERRLGALVREHHLIDGPARLRHEHARALVDGDAALLDGLAERALHLLAHLVELAVLVLELAKELLGLLFVLVLLGVVRFGQLVVLRFGSDGVLVGLLDRIVLRLRRGLGALVRRLGRGVGAHHEMGQHLGARLLGHALEVLVERLQLFLGVVERLLHQFLELLRRLVRGGALGLLQVPRVRRRLERLFQHLPGALEDLRLELLQQAIDRGDDLLLHLLRDLLELLLRLRPHLGEELLHLLLGRLRVLEAVLLHFFQRLPGVVEELLRRLERLHRLIDQRLPHGDRALRNLFLELVELRDRIVVGVLAQLDDGLGVGDRLFAGGLIALRRGLGGVLRVLHQIVERLHRGLNPGLGAVDDLLDLLLGRAALLVEVLLGLVEPALRFLRGFGGVLLRLLQHRLAQRARRLDGLVEELLGHLVRLLRLIDDGPPDFFSLLGELRLQLLERLDGFVVSGLALGKDRLRLRDGSFSFALRPRVRLFRRGLAMDLQLLRLGDGRFDLLPGAVDEALDGAPGLVAGVVEALLRLVVFSLDGVARLARALLHFRKRALAQFAGGLRDLVEQLARLLVGGLRLIEDGLRQLLRLVGEVLLERVVLLLRGLVRGLALFEDGLGLVDRGLRLVLGPVVGLVRAGLALRVEVVRLLNGALHL